VIIPTSPDAFKKLLQAHEDRIGALEQGKATSGTASFHQRIRVGDAYVEVVDDGSGGLLVRASRADGTGTPVTIATL
jgi:hypothetical protein